MIRKLFGFAFIKPYAEYGPIFLRLLIGAELIRGSQDNIFNHERMVATDLPCKTDTPHRRICTGRRQRHTFKSACATPDAGGRTACDYR